MKVKGLKRRKLDNVALAFPAATGKRDSRVFRIYCLLKENVDKRALQESVTEALNKYPLFGSVLKRGNFWYYFEKSGMVPEVKEEERIPCGYMYEKGREKLLCSVTYGKKRINLEIFHALTDGTGAIEFLSEIVKIYLEKAHGVENRTSENKAASISEQEEDSFSRYYSREKQEKKKRRSRPAFLIRSKRVSQSEIRITESTVSVEKLLKRTRELNISITVYITAILMKAVELTMSRKEKKKPVTVMIPVNLRKYYPSKSMSNFFGWMETEYQFGDASPETEEIAAHVKKRFEEDLKPAQVAARMNSYIRIEKNPLLKFIPLGIKDLFLKIGTEIGGRNVTAVFSNMSAVVLPEEYGNYIERFGAIASTDKLQLCACSYRDVFYLSFSSKYVNSEIQSNFYSLMKKEGVEFDILKDKDIKEKL